MHSPAQAPVCRATAAERLPAGLNQDQLSMPVLSVARIVIVHPIPADFVRPDIFDSGDNYIVVLQLPMLVIFVLDRSQHG
jgi:hypothetical protein